MKRYVIGLVVAALCSGAALGLVIIFINPFSAGAVGVSLILISIFFFVASLFTMLGFILRVLRSRKEVVYAHLATSFRQGLLLAIIVVGSLLLQVFRIFNIFSALLFVAAVVLIELAFQSHTSNVELRNSQRIPDVNLDTKKQLADITSKHKPEPWRKHIPEKTQS